MQILLYILILILQALIDALFFNGEKAWSKVIEDVVILLFIWSPILFKWEKIRNFSIKQFSKYLFDITALYVALRVSIFDMMYNIFSRSGINETGSTTFIWDKLIGYLADWQFWVLRGFFFMIALLIYNRKIK